MSIAVEVRGLAVSLSGQPIIQDLTFTARRGRWFGVMGANGSGKTTLLRTLAGRLAPDSGSLLLNGKDVTRTPRERARIVGFMPELADLPPLLAGHDLIELLSVSRGAGTGPESLQKILGIDAIRDLRIGSMSSGMRQKLAIYTAFLGGREIVILDEPFNWLDPVAAHDLRLELRRAVESGLTVITTLHDASAFLKCDEGLVLHSGSVLRRYDGRAIGAMRRDIEAFENELYVEMKGGRRED